MSLEHELQDAAEELVPEDDRIIGVVFRRSLVVIVAAGAVVVGTLLLRSRGEAEQELVFQRQPVVAPRALTNEQVRTPEVDFTDITSQWGIDWRRSNGAVGEKLLPETMGGGGAFVDYDNDGDPDLVLVGGTSWDGALRGVSSLALYRNDGFSFTDMTAGSGLEVALQGMGVAVGDIDNDGLKDLYVTALGRNHLFHNLGGGRFDDVTGDASVAGADDAWSSSAGFVDIDNDGLLDLFVANYVQWSRELDISLHFTVNGVDRAYGPPNQYPGAHCLLYRNRGDGSFEDVSAAAGIRVSNPSTGVAKAKALAAAFADVDSNGAIDIFVANDTVDNFLFLNRGEGVFDEVGRAWGVATDSNGSATGAMGADTVVHFDSDCLAIAVGNFANEASSLFVQTGAGGGFSDLANMQGVGSKSRLRLSFGIFFFDADLDGRLDLLQSNGHLEDEINEVQPSQTYRQPAQLFWNTGRRHRSFVALEDASVGDLARPVIGRGATYADIDRDGDLDVLVLQPQGPPVLLRNDQALGNHWVRVRLEGGGSVNRDAIGTWVEVRAGGHTQRQQVMPTRSYLCQVESVLTFGLGKASVIEELRVLWSDGRQQHVEVRGVDRQVDVKWNPQE